MTEHDTFLAEYSTWVDRVHRSTPGTESPPADLWQRILVQANPQSKENNHMNAVVSEVVPMAPAGPIDSRTRSGFGHYLNLAATIALVLAVAVAGWFATSRLNQPEAPDSRFALLGQRDEATVCDVDPMTVDEAMIVLVNPYQSMDVDEELAEHYETLVWLKDQSGQTGQPPLENLLTDGPNGELEQEELDRALALGDTYLECVQHGTRAQVFRLLDPAGVHEYLRGMLPLFASEEEARVLIEEELSKSGNTVWTQDFMLEYLENKSIGVNHNPDRLYVDSSYAVNSFLLDAIVIAPIVIYDNTGEVVFETEFGGFPVKNNGRAADYARNVAIAKSPFDGEWYVFNIYRP